MFRSSTTSKTVLLLHLLLPCSPAHLPLLVVLDVLGLPLRALSDAVPQRGSHRLPPPDAAARRDEVGVAARVREGVGRAAGAPAALEGRRPLLLLLQNLHLVLLAVPLDLRLEIYFRNSSF